MITTLDIDIDVLQAAKEIARKEKSSLGRVVSRIFRSGLTSSIDGSVSKHTGFVYRNGIPVLPHREGELITMEHIQNLMDEEGI